MSMQFTPREVAELSGAPKSTVEKAIEERVLATTKARRGRRERRVLPSHAVAYARIVNSVKYRMQVSVKRRLAARLAACKGAQLGALRFELEPAVEMDVGRIVGDVVERAERYGRVRDELIVEDMDILGGAPVIRGTRISVHAVLARVLAGDSAGDLLTDYPALTLEAIEAATIYARSHPLVGRPGGRPWISAD